MANHGEMVGSLLIGTRLNYVAHRACVFSARNMAWKDCERWHMEVLVYHKEAVDGK